MSDPGSVSRPTLSTQEALQGLPLRFGRYVLDRRLGRGGMAEVFAARLLEKDFEKPMCIKRVLPEMTGDPQFLDMFRDEARVAAQLQHVNIVQVFELGDHEGLPFIAMELVDGVSLSQMLKAGVVLSVPQALQALLGIARALDCAHRATHNGRALEIIHRDVTPHNVMVSKNGEVKLADFGIARAKERLTKTRTGVIKGKLSYMAPEQALDDNIDQRVDQFAAGIVLWELLVGKPLFKRKSEHATLDAVVKAQVPAPSSLREDVPGEVDAIVLRMLARDRAARYPRMADVERALLDAQFHVSKSSRDGDLREAVLRTLTHAQPAAAADATAIDDAPTTSDHSAATQPLAAPAAEAVVTVRARPTQRSDSHARPTPAPAAPATLTLPVLVAAVAGLTAALLVVGAWWLLRG